MTSNGTPIEADRTADITTTNAQISRVFQNASRVLITSHIRPDGDAVGSLLGLGLALQQAGKTVRMVLADGVPHSLRHLEGSKQVQRAAGDMSGFDLVIVVDASDLKRVGGVLNDRTPDLNIDHHVTNLRFAAVNLVIPAQVATAAIIARYLPDWGLEYSRPVADALLTGIVTDTIGFRTSNMTAEALRLSAMLMDQGAELPELYQRALTNKTFSAARYWSYGLSRMQSEPAGISESANGNESGSSMVWTSLTLEDRVGASYPGNDDADLVSLLSSIDADIAVIFVEQKNEHVKVSWRARPGFDVSQIALQFGGGGHPAAAGADIAGTLEVVQEQVLAATRMIFSSPSAQRAEGDS